MRNWTLSSYARKANVLLQKRTITSAPKDGRIEKGSQNVVDGFSELFKTVENGKTMHDKWEWSLWHFTLSLIPASVLFVVMHYGRKDMEATKALADMKKGASENESFQKNASQINQKIEELESQLSKVLHKVEQSEEAAKDFQNKLQRLADSKGKKYKTG